MSSLALTRLRSRRARKPQGECSSSVVPATRRCAARGLKPLFGNVGLVRLREAGSVPEQCEQMARELSVEEVCDAGAGQIFSGRYG